MKHSINLYNSKITEIRGKFYRQLTLHSIKSKRSFFYIQIRVQDIRHAITNTQGAQRNVVCSVRGNSSLHERKSTFRCAPFVKSEATAAVTSAAGIPYPAWNHVTENLTHGMPFPGWQNHAIDWVNESIAQSVTSKKENIEVFLYFFFAELVWLIFTINLMANDEDVPSAHTVGLF